MSNQISELYNPETGFSDKASLDEIKIFIAKQVKVYNDAIVKKAEAEIKLREANSVLSREHEKLNHMWLARGHWLNREVRRV